MLIPFVFGRLHLFSTSSIAMFYKEHYHGQNTNRLHLVNSPDYQLTLIPGQWQNKSTEKISEQMAGAGPPACSPMACSK